MSNAEKKIPSARLREALDRALEAKKCIGQNRGLEREQAREGYESSLEDLSSEILGCVEEVIEEGILEGRDLEALAKSIGGIFDKAGR